MWFAASRPAVPNITKADLTLNRRVEIFVQERSANSNIEVNKIPVASISKQYSSITFNRNDYFLDAKDRTSLKNTVRDAAENKCIIFSLIGTRDQSSGSNNSSIAEDRINAVRSYITSIYPKIQFKNVQVQTSSVREVRISCSN
jgi:outer membrane protein OmpA-like peptidoglycan-associated protein